MNSAKTSASDSRPRSTLTRILIVLGILALIVAILLLTSKFNDASVAKATASGPTGGASSTSHSMLELTDHARAMAAVETAPIERRKLTHQIGAIGKIQFNERALATVTARVDGYIENLFVDFTRRGGEGWLEAGLKRIRPSMMTMGTTIFGLMPIFWATGRGSDVMQPMAMPSVGGMVVSLLVTTFIPPCLFCAVEERKWKRAQQHLASTSSHET